MIQQNVDGSRHDEMLDRFIVRYAVVEADEIKRVAAQSDGCALLTEYADALRGEQPGDGFFRVGEALVVSEAAKYAIGSTKASQRLKLGRGDILYRLLISLEVLINGDRTFAFLRSCPRFFRTSRFSFNRFHFTSDSG